MPKKSIRREKKLHQKIHHHIIKNPLLSISLLILLIVGGVVATQVFAAKPVPPTGQFEAISVNNNGELSNNGTNDPFHMTKDARFFVFESNSSNLDPNDTNNAPDLFLKDRVNGTTELVSILPDGTQPINNVGRGSISDDGQFVIFSTGGNIYIRNLIDQTTQSLLSGSDLNFQNMSPDSRYIIYRTRTGADVDCSLFDRQTSIAENISIGINGEQGNNDVHDCGNITDDGRYVVFSSGASNLVPNDTNNTSDVFIRDRVTSTTTFAFPSLGHTEGGQAFPYITNDGRFIVFYSGSSNLVSGDTNSTSDVFLIDRQLSTIERVSITNNEGETTFSEPSTHGYVTDDGRYVAFISQSPNLNPYREALFSAYLRDRTLGTTELIAQNPFCKAVMGVADVPHVSSDGRYVAFFTGDSAVSIDNNELGDIYLRDRTIPFGRLPKRCN